MPSRTRVLHPSTPQSLIFRKSEWTVAQAKAWLEEHGFKYSSVDRKKNTIRFRQFDPKMCLRDSYGTKRWTSRTAGKQVLATFCRVPQTVAKAQRAMKKRKTARRKAA